MIHAAPAAKRRALPYLEEWGERFSEIRLKYGLVAEKPAAGSLDTSGWTWPHWEALGSWFAATLLEDDLQLRLKRATGTALLNRAQMPRLGTEFLARAFDLKVALESMTPIEYAAERLAFVQRHVGRLGVRVRPGSAYFDRFMAECLTLELRVCKTLRGRELNNNGFDHPHPDTVQGPWRGPVHNDVPFKSPSGKFDSWMGSQESPTQLWRKLFRILCSYGLVAQKDRFGMTGCDARPRPDRAITTGQPRSFATS